MVEEQNVFNKGKMMLTDEEIEKVAKPFLSGIFGFHLDEYGIRHDGTVNDFARAVIAANNAKVLANLKPATVYQVEEAYDAWELNGDASTREPMFYLDSQVSALIQDRDALAARVKELETELTDIKDGIELASRGF